MKTSSQSVCHLPNGMFSCAYVFNFSSTTADEVCVCVARWDDSAECCGVVWTFLSVSHQTCGAQRTALCQPQTQSVGYLGVGLGFTTGCYPGVECKELHGCIFLYVEFCNVSLKSNIKEPKVDVFNNNYLAIQCSYSGLVFFPWTNCNKTLLLSRRW